MRRFRLSRPPVSPMTDQEKDKETTVACDAPLDPNAGVIRVDDGISPVAIRRKLIEMNTFDIPLRLYGPGKWEIELLEDGTLTLTTLGDTGASMDVDPDKLKVWSERQVKA